MGPRNKKEAEGYRYNRWAGNRNGTAYDLAYCAAEVANAVGWGRHQCSRRPGHGKNGIFCKQHAKDNPDDPITITADML